MPGPRCAAGPGGPDRRVAARGVRRRGRGHRRTGRGRALVAVGGYGRGELSPGSDLDLRAAARRPQTSAVGDLADRIWYPVWDTGVRLDHSVRTFDEARRLASADLAVLLGLLDARHVAGDPALVGRLRTQRPRRLARGRPPSAARAARGLGGARRAGRATCAMTSSPTSRRAAAGCATLLSLRAVAASWVADRPHRDVDDAVRRLADVRDALQLVTGRRHQPAAAAGAGPGRRRPRPARRRRPAARGRRGQRAAVTHAAEVTWRRALQATRPQRSPVRARPQAGAASCSGRGWPSTTARRCSPPRPTRRDRPAARAAAGGRAPPRPGCRCRRARSTGWPPTPRRCREPWPAERPRPVRRRCSAPGAPLVPVWEALDQAGLIARLLPEWDAGAAPAAAQRRAPLHRRPAPASRRPCRRVRAACARCAGPTCCWSPRCCTTSARARAAATTARPASRSPGRSPPGSASTADDVATLAPLVRHHLLLVETATRRDLDDPATVAAVADGARHHRGARAAARPDRGRRAGHRAGRLERVEGGARGRPRTPDRTAPARRTRRRRRRR